MARCGLGGRASSAFPSAPRTMGEGLVHGGPENGRCFMILLETNRTLGRHRFAQSWKTRHSSRNPAPVP